MANHVGTTTYQCLNCRLAQRAEVQVVSLPPAVRRGQGRGEANTAIAMLLALKRCPRCGHYDRNVASHNRHNVRVALITYCVLLGAVLATLYAIPAVPPLASTIASGVLVLGFIVLYFRMRSRYPASAEGRVTLIGKTSMNQERWY